MEIWLFTWTILLWFWNSLAFSSLSLQGLEISQAISSPKAFWILVPLALEARAALKWYQGAAGPLTVERGDGTPLLVTLARPSDSRSQHNHGNQQSAAVIGPEILWLMFAKFSFGNSLCLISHVPFLTSAHQLNKKTAKGESGWAGVTLVLIWACLCHIPIRIEGCSLEFVSQERY